MTSNLVSSLAVSTLALACFLAIQSRQSTPTLPGSSSSGLRQSGGESFFQDKSYRQLQEGTWETITYDDFESGWGSFRGGGSDAARIYVYQATNHDVTPYSDLLVSFWFRPRKMENGESFVLEYTSDGAKTWTPVKRWVIDGNTYKNSQFYQAHVEVPVFQNDFTNQARIRFRCEGSENSDFVYIDEVSFQGLLPSSPPPTPSPTPSPTVPFDDDAITRCTQEHCGAVPVTTMQPTECDFRGIERAQLDVFAHEGVDLIELMGPKNPSDAAGIVLSVPHGGYELLNHLIPDREETSPIYCPSGSCGTIRDSNTLELALVVMDFLIKNYCKVPYVVINKLHRSKLDANREILEAAHGNLIAEQAWFAYHNFIRDAQSLVIDQLGTVSNIHHYEGARGLLVDFHGYSGSDWDATHGAPFIHWGYRLNTTDLDPNLYCPLDDRSLWSNSEVGTLSHMRFLPNQSYECLVRGPGSLGSRLSNLLPDISGNCGAGLPSSDYPSPLAAQTDSLHCEKMTGIDPGACKYFSSGYNIKIHEHLDWMNLTGIKFNTVQMELPRCIRFNSTAHAPFADSLSVTLCSFLRDVFGEGLC